MNPETRDIGTRPDASFELAKWVAIAAMTVDHYGKIVDPDVYLITHMIGRIAFPLFAAIVGIRLAYSPGLARRYLLRLLPWAVLSQPIYVLAGRGWLDGNILFTLALGVAACIAVQGIRSGTGEQGGMLLIAVALCSLFVEFGPFGVAMIPIIAWIAAFDMNRALWLVGPLGLLANLRPELPFLWLADTTALAASAVALVSVRFPIPMPRWSRHVFYAYYPAHLLALHLYDVIYWWPSGH